MEELSERDKEFIFILLHNGGKPKDAAIEMGLTAEYGYILRKKLSKHIIDAANDMLAIHAVQATNRLIDSIDGTMPNSTNLTAALALLDRVGLIKKDPTLENLAAKANIFILPAKDDKET